MTALLAAETRRLLSTRIWLWSLAASIATGSLVTALAFVGPENFDPPMPGLDTPQGVEMVVGMAGLLAFVPALLGTTAITAEYRHQTITFTYLFAPRRWTVLAAKLGVYAAGGLVYGVATVTIAGAGTALAGGDVPFGLLARIAALMAVYTIFGAAFGALLRNQAAALVVLGGYFYMGELLLMFIPGVNAVYPYLPGGASAAVIDFTFLSEAMIKSGFAATPLLPSSAGAGVLLGYALVATVLALFVSLRRDVT